jgi:hypothetical protein
MKILMRGAVVAAVLAFAAAAQAGPGNDGYGRPGNSGQPSVTDGPGNSTPYASRHRSMLKGPGGGTPYASRHRRARSHHARRSASDHMADQLNRAELDRLGAGTGQQHQYLHTCYYNPDCD